MKKKNETSKTITFVVPTEEGDTYEINLDKNEVTKIPATKPLVEIIAKNAVYVAGDNKYDFLMLDL